MLKPEQKMALDKFVGEHNGKPMNKEAMLKPNPVIAKVLVARLMAMPQEDQQMIRSIITAQSAGAVKKLLPELATIIDRGSAMANNAQGTPNGG